MIDVGGPVVHRPAGEDGRSGGHHCRRVGRDPAVVISVATALLAGAGATVAAATAAAATDESAGAVVATALTPTPPCGFYRGDGVGGGGGPLRAAATPDASAGWACRSWSRRFVRRTV